MVQQAVQLDPCVETNRHYPCPSIGALYGDKSLGPSNLLKKSRWSMMEERAYSTKKANVLLQLTLLIICSFCLCVCVCVFPLVSCNFQCSAESSEILFWNFSHQNQEAKGLRGHSTPQDIYTLSLFHISTRTFSWIHSDSLRSNKNQWLCAQLSSTGNAGDANNLSLTFLMRSLSYG